MNEIVSFSKEIEFSTMINKITSISLEHTLMLEKDCNIKGDLIVEGTYRQTLASQIERPFSYKLPVDIVIDDKYDLRDLTIDIDNFTYEVVDESKLKVNIELLLDNLIRKEKESTDTDNSNEIVTEEDLFLENDDKEELNIPDTLEEKVQEVKEVEDNKVDVNEEFISNDDVQESLFSTFDSSKETYSTYSVYIFKENDNLTEIMEKYKVSKETLEEYNDLNNISKGTKIIIPKCSDE